MARFCDFFDRVAADRRYHIAIYGLSEGRSATFAAIAADARALESALATTLPAAPCVVSAIGNRIAFVPFLLAATAIDAAVVLLDGDARFDDVAAIGDRLGADAIVVRGDTVAKDVTAMPIGAGLSLVPRQRRADAVWTHEGRTSVVLKMTSGSSERPRAVVATEAQLLADGGQVIEAMAIAPQDVNLAAIPLAHSYGIGNLVMPLIMQGSAIALRDRFVPREMAADVRDAGVTTFPGVPFMFDYLRRHHLAETLGVVRLLITAGAPIAPDTLAFYKRSLGRKIHSFYGTSETGGICYDASTDLGDEPTVGRPMPETTVTLEPTESGDRRVFVRGPAVASGYAGGNPDDGVSAFAGGGFLTGDLGRFDIGGRLTLIGRVSKFINVAGRKVDPSEVESVLRSAALVLEAAVIGVRCDTRGEQVVACVRPKDPSLSSSDLRAYCARFLAGYKVPRKIVLVDGLPVDRRGKLDRPAIERLVGGVAPTPYNAVAVTARVEDE